MLDLDWPGVVLEALEDAGEGELALAVGLDEPSDHVRVRSLHSPRAQPEKVLYDLRINVLGTPKHIALGHLLACDLVDLHGSPESD
eukprot:765830-Hanusia_phi.AAC.9